jgi:hypothetical protein
MPVGGCFYYRPKQFTAELMAVIAVFKKIEHTEYEKLLEYYVTIQANIDEVEKADMLGMWTR